jgi:hypothetical protein
MSAPRNRLSAELEQIDLVILDQATPSFSPGAGDVPSLTSPSGIEVPPPKADEDVRRLRPAAGDHPDQHGPGSSPGSDSQGEHEAASNNPLAPVPVRSKGVIPQVFLEFRALRPVLQRQAQAVGIGSCHASELRRLRIRLRLRGRGAGWRSS